MFAREIRALMLGTSHILLIYESAAEVESRDIATLHDYWREQLAGRAMPHPADLDPANLRDLQPGLVVADYTDHPFRVRYSWVGATQRHYSGEDYTGCFLDEMNWSEKPLVARAHERTYRLRAPVFGRYQWDFREGVPGFSEFGIFPLSADGSAVTGGLSFDDYSFFEQQLGRAR
jgi:hypothetical protein